MIVFRHIPSALPEACVATIGFFDGVHQGHEYLIEQVKELAAQKKMKSAVVTFPVHPRKVMNAIYKPELLTNYDEKITLLEQKGIDYCFVLDFAPAIAALSAETFMRTILKEQLNVQGMVIGHDHRFGHNRSNDFEDYCQFGAEIGIYIVQARARTINNTTVSSSAIRRLLNAGDVDLASKFLGYDYSLCGTVVGGHRIGRTIGFPTANIAVNDSEKLIPADGVYAVRVTVEGKSYIGMLNIGHRPTINNGLDRSIEVHILEFNADIYNFSIRVSFLERIRTEMKFSNREELIEQLIKDAKIVKSLLK
ncbi:bifunctional riboflavin kinase/FAD synthetase [Bacteroides sp. 214]|uniref:bifunctional riboflavin kinase/FAD synthetase n=1 Tax=Bacteroides sp. 214 TaxID=2302935 RepID=UPI0013D49B13|nr:bifunctional riboflavin kinase/FAD synthetase [Bacteroides sp. 214]NDW12850.1 bifunctional riboflavin kinase/FAD synthetase [Bacteroides sp. 214]